MIEGTTWTMAGLLSTTSGIPFYRQEFSSREEFVPGVTNLGDILEQFGYNQKFICGSEAWFANRDIYFKTHGDYEIVDYFNSVEKKYVPEDYYVNWGIEDYKMLEIAKKEILDSAQKDAPFNCTILTVDTHATAGFLCDVCDNEYENKTANVVTCTDRLINAFLEWCKEQDFYENTTIVITGDHPRMDGCLVEGVSYYDRRVYDCFINSKVEPKRDTDNRMVLSMDIFPTTLAAMGFEIEGDKLGLGTNLFSKQDTLAEKIGFSKVYAESAKKSSFYVENFHQVNAK